ncbi:MAG: hypothetical protein HKO92_04980 [Flavobacteriaceae bacterium]|nr:hypothetical protein [Flavobacteriaceae bacterium]
MGVNGELSTLEFLYGNCLFLGIIILYNISYHYLNRTRFKDKKLNINPFRLDDKNINNRVILSFSLLCTFIFFIYFDFNLEVVFHRKVFLNESQSFSKPVIAIINVFRGAPLILFLYYKLNGLKNAYLEIALIFLIVICNFPTGISRYRVAVTYLPLFLIYIKPFLKKYNFSSFFIICFLIVFPYLHHFRFNSNVLVNPVNFGMFLDLHFDSYQNSVNIIMNKIITYGDQLIGVLFFWIPRAIWESKPIGSSYLLANNLEYQGFSNVAIGFFAEGYINFGIIGIIIFVLLLALVNSWLDFKFWFRNNLKSYFIISYLLLIPFEFLILRGSLRSSFANLCGYLFFTYFFYILLKIKLLRR